MSPLLLAGSMWFYVQYVLIPYQLAESARLTIPRGNLSDLYPRWLGARELLLHRRDPYSADVTREIQAGYYGRPLDATRPNDPKDQQGFAYPLYVVFLLAPTIELPFELVQVAFRWLLVLLTIVSMLLWLRALRWRPSASTTSALLILTLGSFQILQGIKLQQLSLLVAALIAACAWLVTKNHLLPAGILLALATIKPQLVLPFAVWLLLWAVSNLRKRKNLVSGFALTMAVLLAASEYVLPGWLTRFRHAIAAYRSYNTGAESTLEILLTPGGGRALTVLILLALVPLAWRFRRAEANSLAFQFIRVLLLATTVVLMPKAAPYNQILLLPAILFVAQYWQVFWRKSRLVRLIFSAATALLAWPWIATFGLTAVSWAVPAQSLQRAWALPIYTMLAIPLGVAALLAVAARELLVRCPPESQSRPCI